MSLSAVIITLNETKNIEACLQSVRFCDELVVVDSGSVDGTADLARSLGARVWQRPFDDFSSQKNFAIQKASGDWVLLLDADERVTEALKEEIILAVVKPEAAGYSVRRHNYIFGRLMKHGGNAGDMQLRLVKKDQAVFHGVVHERVLPLGKTGRFKNPLLHFTTATASDYMKKLNAYTDLEVLALSTRRTEDLTTNMARKPLLRLAQLLVLKRAVFDGIEGCLFAFLSAYYDFVSLAKNWERSHRERGAPGA